MAVYRIPPRCPICEEEYEAICSNNIDLVGDNFIMWDTERHICKDNPASPLSRYEERLERIVDTVKNITTLEAICLLAKYIPKLPNED